MPKQASQTLNNFMGDNLSVNMLRAVGNGVADDGPAFQAAIDYLHDNGGGELKVPAQKTYLIKTPITLKDNVYLVGQGENALLKRDHSVDLPENTGLLNVKGSHCGVRRVRFDGATTVSAGVNYSAIIDPADAILSRNTTIWIHGGSRDVRFEQIGITHTGGYAVYLDARKQNVEDVVIDGSIFENNRPHLFGFDDADLRYGSWTGGIFYKATCVGTETSSVRGLRISNCDFRRNSGNQIWGHANGFDSVHYQIYVTGNRFLDIGLDCVLIGVASTGSVSDNTVRRVGYICNDDDAVAEPRRLAIKPATAFDTSGCAKGFTYSGNTGLSIHGGTVDLDGFCYGSVTGNVFRVPVPGEPEYIEDRIGEWADNVCIGINTGNTYFPQGGEQVLISNNMLMGMKFGGIRLSNARSCRVTNNIVVASADHALAPIFLFNTGGDDFHRAYNNDIFDNTLIVNSGPGVEEFHAGNDWSRTDRNWVAGNKMPEGGLEFKKHPSSGSTTMQMVGSQADNLSVADPFTVKRLQNADGFPFISWDRADGNYMMRLFDDGTLLLADSGGMISRVFNALAVGTDVAIQQKDGTFAIRGNGNAEFQNVIASATFNSLATGNTAAIQQGSGTFVIRGNGTGEFQNLIASVFNSVATGSDAAFQQAGGTFVIRGDGSAAFQSVTAGVFNSVATGDSPAFVQSSGTFVITGAGNAAFQSLALTNPLAVQYGGTGVNSLSGLFVAIAPQGLGTSSNVQFGSVVAGVFNSTASGSDAAFQQGSGTFVIRGDGSAAFQSMAVTNGISAGSMTAGVFNSTASGGAAAFQQAGGTFIITGAGNAAFQSVAVTNGVSAGSMSAGVFNATASGGAAAFQQASGTFVITGAGNAAFQSVAVTNSVSAGSMSIGGQAVATEAYVLAHSSGVSQSYVDSGDASARSYAEAYSDGQNYLALSDHIAAWHGSNLH